MESGVIQKFSPIKQGVVSLLLGVLLILLSRMLSSDTMYPFLFAFVAVVAYCITNAFFSLFNNSFARYVWPSWGIFVVLTALLLLFARFVSNTSIQEHREFIQMLISVVIFYVLFSLMMRLMRMLWQYAEADKN
jgi:drug/metabolite transporter (DMT)-like permease